MLKKIRLVSMTAVVAIVASVSVAAAQAAPASAQECTYKSDLYRGTREYTCVRYLQRMLNGLGAAFNYSNYKLLDIDGSFGDRTYGQVRAFQDWTDNLQIDGRVGQKTWSALCWNVPYARWINPWVTQDAIEAARAAGCSRYVPAQYL